MSLLGPEGARSAFQRAVPRTYKPDVEGNKGVSNPGISSTGKEGAADSDVFSPAMPEPTGILTARKSEPTGMLRPPKPEKTGKAFEKKVQKTYRPDVTASQADSGNR